MLDVENPQVRLLSRMRILRTVRMCLTLWDNLIDLKYWTLRRLVVSSLAKWRLEMSAVLGYR